METSLFNRLQATLLALATVGSGVLAVLNLRQESKFQQPDDGVWWVEASGGLEATKVIPDSPGKFAGIQTGDLLTGGQRYAAVRQSSRIWSVNFTAPVSTARHTTRSPGTAFPSTRQSWSFPSRSIAASYQGLRVIGLIYLVIGLYVLFRRWTAPRATHFYLFCLVSFALYALKYTGEFDGSSTGLSSGSTSSPKRCSPHSSCTSPSASLRSASRICAAAGCLPDHLRARCRR